MDKTKKEKGQFFTTASPFNHSLFQAWLATIPNIDEQVFLEPFAGSNNIPFLLSKEGIKNQWACFDIDPSASNSLPAYSVEQRNSLKDFPSGFSAAITNPPYLAKNSAKRDGVSFPATSYDDLYKLALDTMLGQVAYVAAIIPESFITSGLFHNRLYGVVSLTCKMFDDTDCPVCLALFCPEGEKAPLADCDFHIYQNTDRVGLYSDILKQKLTEKIDVWDFNSPNGVVGLYAIDSPNGSQIHFCLGSAIDSARVKSSSRGVTRISVSLDEGRGLDIQRLIDDANAILATYRKATHDVFLTSFRGLRKDGKYRRRLDYKQAQCILSLALKRQIGDK